MNDTYEAGIGFASNGHDGAGWYYWDYDYPDEGSVGPFSTREEAEAHARTACDPGYNAFRLANPLGTRPAVSEAELREVRAVETDMCAGLAYRHCDSMLGHMLRDRAAAIRRGES